MYENYHIAHSTKKDGTLSGSQNLVVCSRFPIQKREEILHNYVPEMKYQAITSLPSGEEIGLKFDRSILYVEINIEGYKVHIITVHFKSKIPTKVSGQYTGKPDYQYGSAQGYAE